MKLFERFFGPKISKLEEQGDMAGLLAVLDSDHALEQRVAALEAAVRLGGEEPPAVLTALLGSDQAELTAAAKKGLAALGDQAIPALVTALDGTNGATALKLLVALGTPAVEPLREAAASAEKAGRERALGGLQQLAAALPTEELREVLFRSQLAALGDRSPELRRAAAATLERQADPRAARALAAQLKDGDEEVREGCRKALAAIGPEAVPEVALALGDRNAKARRLAAELLGALCTEGVDCGTRREVLGRLLTVADDREQDVREAVRRALTIIPCEDVLEAELVALADPETGDREACLEYLELLLVHGTLPEVRVEAVRQRIQSSGFNLSP